jgi:long-chain acyl-CoA synthetase
MLTHANIVSDAAAAGVATQTTSQDSYISYLPLAHMYERMMQVNVWGNGGSIGFCRGVSYSQLPYPSVRLHRWI